MNFEIKTISVFDKNLKKLAKKYPSIKNDLIKFAEEISVNPKQGVSLGKNCYKIRFKISDKGTGKSGGARIITHIALQNNIIFLLSIYDKSDYENISEEKIKELLQLIKDV